VGCTRHRVRSTTLDEHGPRRQVREVVATYGYDDYPPAKVVPDRLHEAKPGAGNFAAAFAPQPVHVRLRSTHGGADGLVETSRLPHDRSATARPHAYQKPPVWRRVIALGALLPLFGLSMLAVLLVDRLVSAGSTSCGLVDAA
jgi:hypothetical protein